MRRLILITILALSFVSKAGAQELTSAACETTAGDGPVPVYISFFINSFRDFDSVTETYVVDFFLNLRWEDPAYRNIEPMTLSEPPCFRPQLTFINGTLQQREPVEDAYDIIYSGSDYGIVQSLSRYTVLFNTNLDLKTFPHDSHTLPIIIEDFILDRSKLQFLYEKAQSGVIDHLESLGNIGSKDEVLNEEYLGLQEWEIDNIGVSVGENTYSFFDNAVFSQFRFSLDVSRNPGYYTVNATFIALLITSMCFAVFFLPTDSLGERLGLASTIFLAVVAHSYVVQLSLPKISYLTALDYQMMVSKLMVFLTFFESVVVYLFATGSVKGLVIAENDQMAERIDTLTKYLFPLLIFATLFIR